VWFDPARQLFVEKRTKRPYPGFAQVHCDLDTASLTDFLGRMQKVGKRPVNAVFCGLGHFVHS
jgi:hypothetical protein